MVGNLAASDEEANRMYRDASDGLRGMARFLAALIEHNPDAPNYITITLETPEQSYEVTVRRCEGSAPADTIHRQQDEIQRLRRRLRETEAAVGPLRELLDELEAYNKASASEKSIEGMKQRVLIWDAARRARAALGPSERVGSDVG